MKLNIRYPTPAPTHSLIRALTGSHTLQEVKDVLDVLPAQIEYHEALGHTKIAQELRGFHDLILQKLIEKLEEYPQDAPNLPWRVIPGRSAGSPRIVDKDNKPICAFGNQARHRGHTWAWKVARLIVMQVNYATLTKEPSREP